MLEYFFSVPFFLSGLNFCTLVRVSKLDLISKKAEKEAPLTLTVWGPKLNKKCEKNPSKQILEHVDQNKFKRFRKKKRKLEFRRFKGEKVFTDESRYHDKTEEIEKKWKGRNKKESIKIKVE